MIQVSGLDHVSLAVPDVEATTDFYVEHWGLQLFDESEGRRFLRTAESGHHSLALTPATENDRGLAHLAFEVATSDDLHRAVEEAAGAGRDVLRPPGDATEPGHRQSAALADPDGNVVELLWAPERVTDTYRAPFIAPRKLGHVVLHTPQPETMEAFYGRLGFRVSDRTARGMSFLRCNRDHHTLAFLRSHRTGLQHVAYDVTVLDDVMRALARFRGVDIPCIWGPGRHGPGNNVFTYYTDPAGNVIEYYAELEQVDDPDDAPLEERYWGPEWGGDVWGLAGPPPESFRS